CPPPGAIGKRRRPLCPGGVPSAASRLVGRSRKRVGSLGAAGAGRPKERVDSPWAVSEAKGGLCMPYFSGARYSLTFALCAGGLVGGWWWGVFPFGKLMPALFPFLRFAGAPGSRH
ncbi:hypothetical protein DQ04_18911010, partial [Trypanosoma grayi]|uniref:hypothetical protein n=1 Tax=Trypanosoma grayi TaxID=71804 RepID=UPI0004F4AA4B